MRVYFHNLFATLTNLLFKKEVRKEISIVNFKNVLTLLLIMYMIVIVYFREQKLFIEASDWEAKFYQIQSKYLLLLNELHNPQVILPLLNQSLKDFKLNMYYLCKLLSSI